MLPVNMHVLFIPSWYPAHPDDPFGSFFREQALAMLDAGCTVGVVAPRLVSLASPLKSLSVAGRTHFEFDEGLPTYRRASVNWTPRLWRANARRIAASGWKLYQNYREEHGRPDIVHVHSTIMGGAAAKTIWERDGVPFLVSEHSSAYARKKIPSVGIRIASAIAREAAARFAVSKPFARLLDEELSENFGWQVMPNIVQKDFFNEDISHKGNWPLHNFLHVSFLDPNKNVKLILDAFAIVASETADCRLTIGGGGPQRSELIEHARSIGIDSMVEFVGNLSRENVRRQMLAADSFLLSSDFESFGVVLIEALAMGLPLVATRCGGPEDIVTVERGILVPKDDVRAYAEAMRHIVESKGRYDPQKLRETCAAEYGPDAISARWMEIYREATAQASHVA